MASAFSDSLIASGGWKQPPEISKTTKGMILKFLPDIGTHQEALNKKTGPVFQLQTKFPKNPIVRHANFTKFCRIITIEVRNEFWKFQINISKIGYFQNNVKNAEKAGLWNTERPIKCELGHVTSPNSLEDVVLLASRHQPSFKSFR